jgi:CRISPR-associated endoribonuclease Cas6
MGIDKVQYIDLRIDTDLEAPFFVGSMIRGALGVNLKDVVCVNPSFECEKCFAKDNCLYYEFYEEKNQFHNYALDYRIGRKKLKFGLKLFNDSIDKYPYILSAIEKMVTKKGLGKDRKTTQNITIEANDTLIYDKEFKKVEISPKSVVVDKSCQVAKLKLVTPLRIKKNGKFVVDDSLSIRDILISIVKKKKHFSNIDEKIEEFPTVVMKNIKHIDLSRYSNRQKTKMKVGGVVGEMVLSNISPQVFALLKYGEITGVGKLNSFGLGKIEMECLG